MRVRLLDVRSELPTEARSGVAVQVGRAEISAFRRAPRAGDGESESQIAARTAEVAAARQQELIPLTFLEIVDSLVDGFDVAEVLSLLAWRSVELLSISGAGVMLADEMGQLHVVAATSERVHRLEQFQLDHEQGPAIDCFRSGAVVADPRLGIGLRWPAFSSESVHAGCSSVCAVPLRVRSKVLGVMNLFLSAAEALPDHELVLAQALADVASVAVAQDQAVRVAGMRERHLQLALTSRIVLEQAKGMVAEHAWVDVEQALSRLRSYARTNNLALVQVADAIVTGAVAVEDVAGERRPKRLPLGRAAFTQVAHLY